MACTSGCPTPGAHDTYGDCLRAKSLQVADPSARSHRHSIEQQQKEYVDARREGMQPQTIFKRDVDFAREMTKITGTPFRADYTNAATIKD